MTATVGIQSYYKTVNTQVWIHYHAYTEPCILTGATYNL